MAIPASSPPSTNASFSGKVPAASPHEDSEAPARSHSSFWTRKRIIIVAGILLIIVVILAVVLPVIFLVVKPHETSSTGSRSGSGGSNPSSPTGATTGGDGSTVITENGTQFLYNNSFGGYWVQDPSDPFNNDARPNSWTPPLNTSWTWGTDKINGVNLGGWLVIEPFITPQFFQQYPTAVDEYTLSEAMRADTENGGIGQLEEHYETFISEQDIAEIAGAGLNFIRVPLPFWAIETWDTEPYLERTSWTYFLKVLEWARKYGLRVCLDLHALPGSQNGYNHSGRLAPVNFLAGNMGLANAQRSIYYIRVLTEFISQPQYVNLIPIFGIVNEPLVGVIGVDTITSFYLETYTMMRNITGLGTDHGPFIAIHDGFEPASTWYTLLRGADRLMLDDHPYLAFGGENLAPIAATGPQGQPGGTWPAEACNAWALATNTSQQNFGVTFAGEWSTAPNDCGLFLQGVGAGSTNPQCPTYVDWQNFNSSMKEGIMNFALASQDALQDWFFWTWKIHEAQNGTIGSPLWSYQLGLRNGWIPQDPRTSTGKCESLGTPQDLFNLTFLPWETGTPSSIPASSTSSFPWPPSTISGDVVPNSLLPTYTNTAPIITMPPGTFSGAPSSVTSSVDGWFDKSDTAGGVTAIVGCTYPDEYNGIFSVTPTVPCTGPTATA